MAEKKKKNRVLFIRSNCQATFAAFVASALDCSEKLSFEQFPCYSPAHWKKIKKIYAYEEGVRSLSKNVIYNKNELLDKLSSGSYDLVLFLDYDGRLFSFQQLRTLKKMRYSLGQFKKLFRVPFRQLIWDFRLMRGLSLSLAEINSTVPVAVVDFDDWICLPVAGQQHLSDCSFYFKRELPFNRFFLYYQKRPAPWRVWRQKLAPSFAKVRNIPLGIEDKKYFDLKGKRSKEQDIDIFYCGEPTSSPRLAALRKLKELSLTTSWNIVIDKSLPFDEYCEKIARSKITISISGGGWDCFRHYEAVALGSIPFMDTPVVDAVWWRDCFLDIFFSNTFDNFESLLGKLLSASLIREQYLCLLEERIESYMLHSKIIEHIVENSLQEI